MSRTWQLIVEIAHIIATWLKEHYSAEARRKKAESEMFEQAKKENDTVKLHAALERRKRRENNG